MLEATQKEPEYLSPEEAAPRLGVNAKTIRLNLANGKLRGVKIGRVWRLQWPPQSQQAQSQ